MGDIHEVRKYLFLLVIVAILIVLFFSIRDNKTVVQYPAVHPKVVAPSQVPVTPSVTSTPMRFMSAKPGKSPGIFYPYTDAITINNDLPTIIGKLNQQDSIYLATQFGVETSPVSGEDEYFLRFLPGAISPVKSLKVFVDFTPLYGLYGIPQYPTISCGSEPITEEKCLQNNKTQIPPLLFFTKPLDPLPSGTHTLTVLSSSGVGKMQFSVDPLYNIEDELLYELDRTSQYYYLNQPILDSSDNCSEGYYYDSNYVKIPLPVFNNQNMLYAISFPQTIDETGDTDRRKMNIRFSGLEYDLFFPSSDVFFEGKSFRNNTVSPYQALFLPVDHLMPEQGPEIMYANAYNFINANGNYDVGYFEIFPIDVSGGTYEDTSIPWIVSGSSGCDG